MADHLAILKQPYLELILRGEKTIECRLTRTPKPPFGVLQTGQRIYLKQSSGPVRGVATAGKVICRRIDGPEDLKQIRQKYLLSFRADGDNPLFSAVLSFMAFGFIVPDFPAAINIVRTHYHKLTRSHPGKQQ